ncbi:hypothetical protein OH76DRAFT_1404589 [Lentinus brumalis]|uniref:Uncharacterized protein n=1 Tax=Lentinus brumalis TaxID=2498619 RepID=A0A371D818_9APHY|nr:hypothetical protein OH76DRAFT_1404589 [Polyporus brumalis]
MSFRTPFCPLPGAYGVAQINVEASLDGVADPKTLEAAQGLGRAKCLIYFCTCLQLPFPESPSCKYTTYLVGPGPRPNDPARYSTADMCVPIFPCVDHPTNRPAVRPNGPFPFSNCYHWTGLGMERRVRVAIRDYTEYDNGKVASLPGIQHIDMDECFSEDFAKGAAAMRAAEAANKTLQAAAQIAQSVEKARPAIHDEEEGAMNTTHGGPSDDMADIAGLEIYGLTYKAEDDLLPVINVWLDLGSQFPEESDVPSPLEFVKEYDTMVLQDR